MPEPALLKTITFSKILRWAVYDHGDFLFRHKRERLGEYVSRVKTVVNVEDDVVYNRLTVRSRGKGVVLRDSVMGRDIGTKRQFRASAGQLVISRIDARNGAFGVVPNELDGAIVTNDFWLFDVHDMEAEYLVLLLSSERFQPYWQSKSSGTTNRQRVNEAEFLDAEVPVPSLVEQRALLAAFDSKKFESTELCQRAFTVLNDAKTTVQARVSSCDFDVAPKGAVGGLLETVSFAHLNRWEVSYIEKEGLVDALADGFRYPSAKISELQLETLHGLSLKASPVQEPGMMPMLRMVNIVDGGIDLSRLKYLPAKKVSTIGGSQKYLLRKGDLLINRTNSKELVGKSAIFDLDGEYTYASYLVRYRFDESIVMPEFVNIMFALPLVRIQIDTMSRQTAGQCNINNSEIGSIRIPLPSLSEQQSIVAYYNSKKAEAYGLCKRAEELKIDALRKFENEIFQ